MRFMSMITSDEVTPYGPPPPSLMTAMGEFPQGGEFVRAAAVTHNPGELIMLLDPAARNSGAPGGNDQQNPAGAR